MQSKVCVTEQVNFFSIFDSWSFFSLLLGFDPAYPEENPGNFNFLRIYFDTLKSVFNLRKKITKVIKMAEINIHFAFRHVWRWYGTATWTRIQRMLLNLNFFLQQYCLCSIHSGITIILQLRNAIGDTRYLWPHGVVHWTIDSHHSGRYWSYL